MNAEQIAKGGKFGTTIWTHRKTKTVVEVIGVVYDTNGNKTGRPQVLYKAMGTNVYLSRYAGEFSSAFDQMERPKTPVE